MDDLKAGMMTETRGAVEDENQATAEMTTKMIAADVVRPPGAPSRALACRNAMKTVVLKAAAPEGTDEKKMLMTIAEGVEAAGAGSLPWMTTNSER